MAFGPNSINPRERRAYAHTKLAQLKQGEASYEEALGGVKAASHNRKGQASGFAESLGKAAVLLVDWGATSFQTPGVIHHNFGGYLVPRAEAEKYSALRDQIRRIYDDMRPRDFDAQQDPALNDLHRQHNQVHGVGYETLTMTRIFRGDPAAGEHAFPEPGTVINPAEIEDATSFVAWNDDVTVQATISQLK